MASRTDIPNGLQQVAVRFGRLGDLVLIVFEGLPGTCREGQTDIKDVNALIRQVDQGLLEQRAGNRIAPLRSHTPQGLHRVRPRRARNFWRLGLSAAISPLIDRPAVEQGQLVQRI